MKPSRTRPRELVGDLYRAAAAPMIATVTPLAAAVLGLLAGVLVTAVIAVTLIVRRGRTAATAAPAVPTDYESIVHHLRSAAAIVGPHDEVLVSSPSALATGLIRGSRVAVPGVLNLVRDVRREGEFGTLNVEIARGGTLAPHRLAVRVVPLDAGLLLVLADDRAQALRLDETRRDFVANVTHELKTPIGAITLLAEAIELSADDEEAVRRFSAKMGAEAARLNELVSQIIALSRLQSQNPLLAADPVRLDDVVAAGIERCRALAEGRQVVVTSVSAGPLETWGDAGQLETAVTNLIQNAIAYSHEGARVAIATRSSRVEDEEFVEIAVSDNGIGIAEEDQPRLFERFFRVDYGRSRASGGTGLGLSLVKHIAEAHGGSVSVWSRLGQGSTFTVRLPAHHPPSSAASVGPGERSDRR